MSGGCWRRPAGNPDGFAVDRAFRQHKRVFARSKRGCLAEVPTRY
jgi:hypothetical protein